MPTIQPGLVKSIAPGSIFEAFTTDTTLNIRWLIATDPAYYEAINRPIADLAVQTLVLAKAVDSVQLSLGRQNLFPFVVQPQVVRGASVANVPADWIWDISLSLPVKWEQVRLAKIKRIAGFNETTGSYTGILRLIFTAVLQGTTSEIAIFYADYHIDSALYFQLVRLNVVTTAEEVVAIAPGEAQTVAGFIEFRTLPTTDIGVQAFLNLLAPPSPAIDSNGDGIFDTPAVYAIADSVAGGPNVTDDFSTVIVSHGTGMLTDSAWTPIPPLGSDVQSWVDSFNYPFDSTANRTSQDGIVIPIGLFREFNLVAPAGDEPTGDVSGTYFPVWISRIELIGQTGGIEHLRFFFATHNVTDVATGGSPSEQAVEFASLDLLDNMTPGTVVGFQPIGNLLLLDQTNPEFNQHFGRGHVVLSDVWANTGTGVTQFFQAFTKILNVPADTLYSRTATRVSSYGLSRTPKYIPTIGQSRAMAGSTARLTTPQHPNDSNRFVCELDQGLGNQIDLEVQPGITPQVPIDRFGYSGSLCHRIVRLVVDPTAIGNDPNFYDVQIAPRLRILLGRNPIFGDQWYNGTRFMTWNGDSWQG